jgi:Helicase associated domain
MKRKLIRTHEERWERGFAALSKFRKRKRHCWPSRHQLESKFKLGQWVTTQRYFKDDLSVERKKRLDTIGFVWNWRDYRWEQGFSALLKFKRREGHCRVPIQHREGDFNLGIGSLHNAKRGPTYQMCESADLKRSALCGGNVKGIDVRWR